MKKAFGISVSVAALLTASAALASPIITGRDSRKPSQVRMPHRNILSGATGSLQNHYFEGPREVRQTYGGSGESRTAAGGYVIPLPPEPTEAEKKYSEQLFKSISRSPVERR